MAAVVADASALLALGKLDRLALLRDLFQHISIPPTVSHEIARTLPHLPEWIRVIAPRSVEATRDVVGLHQGEIEAIALALEVQASVLILDDLPARQHALGLGLAIIGTAGVLVMAKRANLITSVDVMRPHDVRRPQ